MMENEEHPTRFGVSQFGDGIRKLLVVTAHPDDLETGCGGTIRLLVCQGIEVSLLLCTSGDIGTHDAAYTREALAATRQREALAAARVLGLQEVVFLGRHDGELGPDLALRAEVAGVYRRLQPDTLFTFDPFWSGQAHPDHSAAGRAAVDAYMPSKMELYHPEQLTGDIKVADIKRVFFFGGSDRPGQITIDISTTWDTKVEATKSHVSQFGDNMEEALKWLAHWNHEIGRCCGLECAESFHPMAVW
jgi:LmbE family N-acetylglucosaminyl deacetylase